MGNITSYLKQESTHRSNDLTECIPFLSRRRQQQESSCTRRSGAPSSAAPYSQERPQARFTPSTAKTSRNLIFSLPHRSTNAITSRNLTFALPNRNGQSEPLDFSRPLPLHRHLTDMSSPAIGKVIQRPPAKRKIVVIGLQDKSFEDSRMYVLPFYNGITETLIIAQLPTTCLKSFCGRFTPSINHNTDRGVGTLVYALYLSSSHPSHTARPRSMLYVKFTQHLIPMLFWSSMLELRST
jgi:hypothetical protein